MRVTRLLAAFLLVACQSPPPPAATWHHQLYSLPVGDTRIQARLCRPERPDPAPLVVVSHGSPANPAGRSAMRVGDCSNDAVAWFLARGHAVLLPLRRGYGASGGAWAEGFGPCDAADFVRAGQETARDIAAAVDYATRLPGIRPGGVILVGQSAGGWGSLALAARNPPAVTRVVNMAGGRGGWAGGVSNANCRPDRLVAAAEEYGRTARVPTLWVYTANDSFFAPTLAARMHAAYTGAGGTAELRLLGPWGRDGHALFGSQGGSRVWGPVVEAWLAQGD